MPAPLLARANPSRSPAASNVHAARVEDVFYPSSDGKPMAENMWQGDVILNSVGDLRAIHPEALVAADILMYPEEGNRYNNIAPDVLVAFDIGTHKRSTYRVWEEGKPPDWVLEVASPSTGEKDREFKLRLLRGDGGAGVLAVRSDGRGASRDAAAAGVRVAGWRVPSARVAAGGRQADDPQQGAVLGRVPGRGCGRGVAALPVPDNGQGNPAPARDRGSSRSGRGPGRTGSGPRRAGSGPRRAGSGPRRAGSGPRPRRKRPGPRRKRPGRTGRPPAVRLPRLALRSWRLRCVRGWSIRSKWSQTCDSSRRKQFPPCNRQGRTHICGPRYDATEASAPGPRQTPRRPFAVDLGRLPRQRSRSQAP